MLSRTAANLYWMARYLERAENLARILEVADRMALVPTMSGEDHRNEWYSAAAISGCEQHFDEDGEPPDAVNVARYIALDPNNPSSILSCVRAARDNARAVRANITTEMWEAINGTWLDIRWRQADSLKEGQLRDFLDWVKERVTLFRGCLLGTMLREEAFHFAQVGSFIERADNTARILDVKYHVLLPSAQEVGGGLDHYQWASVLRSVSALGSYHYLYRETPRPWRIAELLILRHEMPRSLIACISEISAHLDRLAEAHGRRHECHRAIGRMYADLRYADAEEIFQNGLHEFLGEFMERNTTLGNQIASSYLFHG